MSLTKFTGISSVLNQPVTTTGIQRGTPADGPYPGVFCSVYVHNSTTLAPIYAENLANNTVANPFLVNADGSYTFWGPDASYDLVFTTTVPASVSAPQVQVPSYTVATLPSASQFLPGRLARVTDGGGGLYLANASSWQVVGAIANPAVNIVDYGAVGDDATDNTAAIQAALNAASGLGGGMVYVPRGIFRTGALTLKDKVSLVGDGPGHTLKANNSLNDSWLSGHVTDVTIRALELDGNKSHNTTGGVIVLGGQRLAVEDCYIHDTPTTGIQLGVSGSGVSTYPSDGQYRIVNNHCVNCGTLGYGAIAVTHGSHVLISGNLCVADDGKQTYGIDIEPNSGNAVHDVTITGNIVTQGRLFLDCFNMSTPGTTFTITGNTVDARGSGADYGLFDNNVAIFVRTITGLVINDNQLVGDTAGVRQAIYVGGPISQFQITGNVCRTLQPAAGTGYGISFNNASGIATDGLIAHNTLIGIDSTPTSVGIHCFHATGWTRVIASENTFHNVTTPYAVGVTTNDSPINSVHVLHKTADYVIDLEDGPQVVVMADATAGQVNVNFYTASGNRGARLTVIKTDGSLNPVYVNSGAIKLMRYQQRATYISDDQFWIEADLYRKPVFNLHDYGARGDGTTDDTTAVQAGLDAVAGGLGILFVPPGTYLCGRMFLATGTTVVGSGLGSVFKLKNGENAQMFDCTPTTAYHDDVHIERVTFDGNKANNSSRGGASLLGRRCVVKECYFLNAAGPALAFGGFTDGATNVPAAGASRLVNNTFINCVTAISVVHASDLLIANNLIQNTDGDMDYGIGVVANTGNTLEGITIVGNVLSGGGLRVEAGSAQATNVTITGNAVDLRGFTGTVIDATVPLYLGTIIGLTVSGNTLMGHTDGHNGGIYVVGPITNFQITGNTILAGTPGSGSSYGILFYNAASIATDGVVAGNTIVAWDTWATGSPAPISYGIYSAHASAWSGVESTGNRFKGVTVNHYISQSGVAVGPDSDWTQKRSWNSGVIADAAVATTTVTFSGAATGDWVHASFANLPAKVFGMASVTAADTVTLSLYNRSGANYTFNDVVRLVLRKYTNEGTGIY